MIHLLAIGCCYLGEMAELPDCDLDALSIADTLSKYLASGVVLNNAKADRRGMFREFRKLQTRMKASDVAIVSFSGHGVTDTIGKKQVQGIVANDLGIIYEHELRATLADLGQAVLIADCCFSGGLVRGLHRKQRWLPASHCFRRDVTVPSRLPPRPHATYLACKAGETAASTGKGGAFTLALTAAFNEHADQTTFTGLHKAVRKLLPNSDYSQTPQFVCKDKAFANRTLRSFNKRWNKRPA